MPETESRIEYKRKWFKKNQKELTAKYEIQATIRRWKKSRARFLVIAERLKKEALKEIEKRNKRTERNNGVLLAQIQKRHNRIQKLDELAGIK